MKTTPLTDAGEAVPNGWTPRKVGELCEIVSGGTPAKNQPDYWQGSIPWVSGKDLKSPRLTDTIDHISESGLQAGSKLAPPGAVLLLVRGMGLAKDLPVATIDRAMAFNQDVKALIPRGTLPGMFLRTAIYVHKDRLLSRMVPSAHGTMTLNLDDVQNLTIPVPNDTAEALAISTFVRFSLRLLRVETELDIRLSELKRVAMQTLFTKGLRGDPSKDSEIGPIPTGWRETTMAELAAQSGIIQTGPFGSQLHAHEYVSDGIPIINPTHLLGNRINHESIPKIAPARAADLKRHVLRKGDLLFARRGEIGRLGLVGESEEGWLCGTGCFLVRVNQPDVDNRFLAYACAARPVVDWLTANAAGAIMPNLNGMVIGRLPLAVPPLPDQREIVAILDAIDQKIALQMEKRAVLEALFQSILQKLMTGDLRVGDLSLHALADAKPEAA